MSHADDFGFNDCKHKCQFNREFERQLDSNKYREQLRDEHEVE